MNNIITSMSLKFEVKKFIYIAGGIMYKNTEEILETQVITEDMLEQLTLWANEK